MKNETKMRPAIKNRILAVLAVLLLGVSILTSYVVFTDFMSHTIYEESTAHLTEIYHQANQTLYNKVSLNWRVMRMWTPYLESAQSDADVCAFLAQAKEEYHFTDFSSSHGMAPISRWTKNEAISIWDECCRSWFWSSSLSWQTRWYRTSRRLWCLQSPRKKAAIRALITRPLPSPTTTKIWWTP